MPGTRVLMPRLGQAMTEGTVVQWHRKDGERIEQGEILLTAETDKATYDLEATASGTLHILVAAGEEVAVDTVIGEISEATGAHGCTATANRAARRVPASPKARHLAAEHGIDLATLTPSAADGVISAADVMRAHASAPTPDTAARPARTLSGTRRTVARRMQTAWQTIPHIVQMIDVEATALRETRGAAAATAPGITLNDLILYAAARVMAAQPELNAAIDGDTLVSHEAVDIGFAVDAPRGLLVPVIRRADTLSLAQLALESQRLIEAARTGRLDPAATGGASLTVSNLGRYGIRAGTAIINPGEACLVFVGAIEDRAVVRDGRIVARPVMTLSIAYDHRIVDGAAAARFSAGLKTALEYRAPPA